jgi:hypothetical protein
VPLGVPVIESTTIGLVAGGLFRLAPEFMRYVDRHLDRRHEEAMQRVALEFATKVPGGSKAAELAMSGPETVATLDALKEAWRQQFSTGDRKLDRVSILVRPSVTYAVVGLYVLVKLCMLMAACFGPLAFKDVYTDADVTFLSGITTFWFLGRPIEKKA